MIRSVARNFHGKFPALSANQVHHTKDAKNLSSESTSFACVKKTADSLLLGPTPLVFFFFSRFQKWQRHCFFSKGGGLILVDQVSLNDLGGMKLHAKKLHFEVIFHIWFINMILAD